MTLFVRCIDRKALPLAKQTELSALMEQATAMLYSDAARRGDDLVVLTTCERVEMYAATSCSTVSLPAHEWPLAGFPWMRHSDADAVRHLFRVAAGLESRLVGEPHILGQVRLALNAAQARGTASRRIRDAFSSAIRCGRRVRNQTALGTTAGDYAARAVAFLEQAIEPLTGRHLAVIGSGSLATDVASALRQAADLDLTIIGRHVGRARGLADLVGGRALTLDQVVGGFAVDRAFDAVIAATSSSRPIVTVESRACWRTGLFVDLGAAPNVDPQLDSAPGTRVVRLADLGGVDELSGAIDAANVIVTEDVNRFLSRWAWERVSRASSPSAWRDVTERVYDVRP